jgi:sterol desaturase/sphingolipid hydroxylase (fatty acid hydroxylase superfamily)
MSLTAFALEHEAVVRTASIAAVALGAGLAERAWPRRGDARLAMRQLANLALIAIDTALIRLLFPVLGIGFAAWIAGQGIGVLNRVALLPWLEVALALIALDLAIYWQHRAFHRFPVLWRAHRVHHCDTGFDLSLGVRFHPFEIALSQCYKFAAIAALGAAPIAVLIFEIALLAQSLLMHADFRLPPGLDRALRRVVVTAEMHRVHHSVRREETDSNYGFMFSFWDRLFGSYRADPAQDAGRMPIGLAAFRSAGEQSLLALLANPFRRQTDTAAKSME